MGTNGGETVAVSMEIETNENPEKVEEPVVRRKRVTRRRHRRIHSKNNCLTPPNSDDDVSLLLFFLNQVRQLLQRYHCTSSLEIFFSIQIDIVLVISQLLIFVLCNVIGDGPGNDFNLTLLGLQNLNFL
ncbi:hypothetical protein CAEBREN_31883 [Caenorhabditis brenneri]|uniref:Uncharacterized protein n=1 Tax=Caenorhabditis brenneri TaxID=135651 RepID=G0MI77_CAEBE|nr:hypothetical protein CAEBREN_31883 [Caenorhabditis brenneri]